MGSFFSNIILTELGIDYAGNSELGIDYAGASLLYSRHVSYSRRISHDIFLCFLLRVACYK